MPAAGDLTLRGPVHFDAPAEGSLRALAFVDNAPERWTDFETTAPRAEVCQFEQRDAEANIAGNTFHTIMPDGRRGSCSNLTSIRVSLLADGSHAGWVAFDARGGILNATMPEGIVSRAKTTIETGDANEGCGGNAASPDQPIFCKVLAAAHLRMAAVGAVEYVGAACLKVKGPDLRVESDQGVKAYTTDDTADQTMPARERVMRWLVVCFPEGTLRFTTPGRVEVAAESARVVWDGNATMTPTAGALLAEGGEYASLGGPVWLDGDFTGSLTPTGNGTAALRLDGDMRATSLRFTSAPAGPRVVPAGLEWVGLALLGAVVAVGVSAGVVVRRRRARASVVPVVALSVESADALLADLHAAEEEDRPRDAAALLARLRRLEPTHPENPRRAVQEAIYRHGLKDYPGALAALDAAMRIAASGHAEWWAVKAALDWEAEDLAESYLVRGLLHATGPAWLALLILGAETDFAKLRERGNVRAALHEAKARAAMLSPDDPPA